MMEEELSMNAEIYAKKNIRRPAAEVVAGAARAAGAAPQFSSLFSASPPRRGRA
jgi:hypothetical protein